MKTFFLKRLKIYLTILAMVSVLLASLDILMAPRQYSAFLIILGILPMLLVNTRWYLLFPHSRKKLILYNAIEASVFGIFNAIVFLVLSWIHFQFTGDARNLDPSGVLTLCAFFTSIKIICPVSQAMRTEPAA